MLTIKLSKQANKTLDSLPSKHARQIAGKIKSLADNEHNVPSVELKGHSPWRRAKSGEYRIIFSVENDELNIGLIGKRNDDEIYRLVQRFLS